MDEPEGRCITCRRRDPRYGLACDACRSRLTGWLAEIPDLCTDLDRNDPAGTNINLDHRGDPDHTPHDHPYDRNDPDTGRIWRHILDPVGVLPPGPLKAPQNHGKVSGSRYPSPPADLAAADLLAPARNGSRAPHARGVLGLDDTQTGDLSVATILDTWVRDWRQARNRGEGPPAADVATLCQWLDVRLGWACDEHPRVDEFAAELREVRSTLYGRLGLHDIPDLKQGVPCRECSYLTLVRLNGSEYIECTRCGLLLAPDEYQRWAGLKAAEAKRRKDDAA